MNMLCVRLNCQVALFSKSLINKGILHRLEIDTNRGSVMQCVAASSSCCTHTHVCFSVSVLCRCNYVGCRFVAHSILIICVAVCCSVLQ